MDNRMPSDVRDSIERPVDRLALTRFCVRFILLCSVLYFLFNWLPSDWVANPICRQTAEMTALLLRAVGLDPSVSGSIVSADGFSIKIIPECTAIFIGVLFFSFITAYPAMYKHKLVGLFLGISFLWTANLLRVCIMFWVGLNYQNLFDIMHVYIGQIMMVFLVLMTSMVWLNSAASISLKDRPVGFFLRFIAYSCLPFILWLYCDQYFVLSILLSIKQLLWNMRMNVTIPERLTLYPHTFNTFNLVVFTALVLATKNIDRKKKIISLFSGLGILCVAQFLFKLHQVLFLDMHVTPLKIPFVALIVINQWILPFSLWLVIVRKELFGYKDRFRCPICGEVKKGIVEHIEAKHGGSTCRLSPTKITV